MQEEKEFSHILDLHGIKIEDLENEINSWVSEFEKSDYVQGNIICGVGQKNIYNRVMDYLDSNHYYISYVNNVGVIIVRKLEGDLNSIINQMNDKLNKLQTNYNLINLNVDGLFGLFNYNITFENKNVFVIHAPNGCGKSNLLRLIDGLFSDKENLKNFPFKAIKIRFDNEVYELTWDENKENIIEYKCGASSLNNMWTLQVKTRLDEILLDVECTYMKDLISYDLNELKKDYLKTLPYHKSKTIFSKVELFNSIMSEFFCFEKTVKISEKWRRASDIDYIFDIVYEAENKYDVPNVYKQGDHIPFESLSTGEQNIIKIIFRLIFGTKYNSLVILDEPEVSLHMEWQLLLINNIVKIAEDYNLKVLIATHSPYILDNPKIEIGNAEYEEEK